MFFSSEKRRALLEVLHHVAKELPLKNVAFRKYPIPVVVGEISRFKILLEGRPKKDKREKIPGFRFLAMIELPRPFEGRVFLQNERRKTGLKPIASLKLVHTSNKEFDSQFLLLASKEKEAEVLLQPLFCEKILALPEKHWQLDVRGNEVLFEAWQERLNGQTLSELLQLVIALLNAA